MPTVSLSDKLIRVLEDFTPGANLEAKYGLTFSDFVAAWQGDTIPNKHSHEVERDFMEWEARHMEKEELLAALRAFRQPQQPSP